VIVVVGNFIALLLIRWLVIEKNIRRVILIARIVLERKKKKKHESPKSKNEALLPSMKPAKIFNP
jgi:hypothetical protein